MRTLHLICYDIKEPKRLRRVSHYLKGYRVDGQKSVYECWITAHETTDIFNRLHVLAEPNADSIHLFRLDPRQTVQCFGQATHFTQQDFFIT